MECALCGGRVEWQGRLTNLTHTKCLVCGEINCQKSDDIIDDGDSETTNTKQEE